MLLLLAILAGFAIQGMLSLNYPRLAAAFGFVITTGVLVYGLWLYARGAHVTLATVPLSRPMFVAGCAAWYVWDALQLAKLRK